MTAIPARITAVLLAAIALIASACGGGSTATASPAATTAAASAAASAAPTATATPARNLDALIADAKKEGKLVLYSPDTEDVIKLEADSFTKKYGIPVDYVRALTDPLVARLSTEFDSGVNAADFFHLSGEEIFDKTAMWKKLDKTVIPDWDAYPEIAKGANFAYLRDAPSVVNYNTKLVTPEKSPKTWNDMLDPQWKGHILLTDPNSSPSYMTWAQDMINTYGVQYLEKLKTQDFKLAASGVPGAQQVAAGTAWIHFPARPVHSAPLRAQGAPIAMNTLGGANGAPIVSGILAKAPHPNAAALFMNYMISRDFQAEFCKANEVMSFWNYDGKSPNLQVAGCLKAPADYKLAKLKMTDAQRAAILKALGL